MICRNLINCILTVAIMPAAVLAADGEGQQPGQQVMNEPDGSLFTSGKSCTNGENTLLAQNWTPLTYENVDESDEPLFTPTDYIVRGQSPGAYRATAVRFGWWGVATSGSPVKVGEYQGLDSSSPFFDIDGIYSDGRTTRDFYLSGPESESTDAGLHLYRGPGFTADIEYQRFIHRLGHDSLENFQDTDNNGSYVGRFTDENPGKNYAIRIQKFDAKFKGRLTDNVKWKLNLWGMRKHGTREAKAMNHGCSDHFCHIKNQSQRIDWLTMEIEPVIEARFGAVTVEYSRTMRSFSQNDETVTRQYNQNRGSRAITPGDHDYPYAVVPDNFTQIDRLKFGADLTRNTDLYANLFVGNTNNKRVNLNRSFTGFDLRVNNRTVDGLTVTGYAKHYAEKNQRVTDEMGAEILDLNGPWGWNAGTHGITNESLLAEFRTPANRDTTKAGMRLRWRPFRHSHRLKKVAFTGAYEYKLISRTNVTYPLTDPFDGYTDFTQPDTNINMMRLGVSNKFSRHFDGYLRYRMVQANNPLYGFTEAQEGTTIGAAINTNQPEHTDIVEIGGTWMPSDNFLLSAAFWVQKRRTNNDWADSTEDDYPVVFSAWYSPTKCWSISGGLSFLSNNIYQDITMGKDHSIYGGGQEPSAELPYRYNSRAQVFNLGTRYIATRRLTLSGTFEYVRSTAAFADPSVAGLDLSYLPGVSDVLNQTTRLQVGVDYLLRDGVACYFHYNYYDFNDKAGNGLSGTANMFLTGVSAVY